MLRVYSLFDRKMREFGALVLAPTDGAVKRGLLEAFRSGRVSTLSQYPADFELHCLGTFDESSGELVGEKSKATGLCSVEELVVESQATQMESANGA